MRRKVLHFEEKRDRRVSDYGQKRMETETVMNIVINGFPPLKSPLTSVVLLS